jgi:hypothetical protein
MLNRKALELKKREEEFKKLEENRKRFEKDHSICHKTMTNGRETQKEKIWQRKQIPLPNGLPFGTNELFLNTSQLKRNKRIISTIFLMLQDKLYVIALAFPWLCR